MIGTSLALFVAIVPSPPAQDPGSSGLSYCDAFGRSVVVPGDLDGDAVPDLLVSAPWQDHEDERAAGAVFAFSGADGKELYRLWGGGPRRTIGNTGRLAAVGDVDGDGAGDFLWTRMEGVALRSGRKGDLIREHEWPAFKWEVHKKVSGLGDIDGDGVPDYAIADRGHEESRGLVRLFSGRTGELVRELAGDAGGDWFGFALSGGMDVDGDGVPDLLVGAPRGAVAELSWAKARGYARVHSGRDGEVLVTVEARDVADCFGQSVALLGDLDGDGRADFAVGAPGLEPEKSLSTGGPGYVRVFSGADGMLLRAHEGPETPFFEGARYGKPVGSCAYNSEFGYSLAAAGDFDADGTPDLIVGARRENGLGGSARVLSGKTGDVLLERVGLPFRDWGHLVGGVGDLDGDGHDDVFHVGLNDTQGALSTGHVMLVSGKTGALLRRLTSPLRPEGTGEAYFR